MILRQRPEPPQCLTEITRFHRTYGQIQNQVAWGLRYQAKRNDSNMSDEFQWATYNNVKVNLHIEDDLKNMTQNHCAFCDIFPLRQSGRTIEHFRPKTRFPAQSHLWVNLFYCCYSCQSSKQEQFEEGLLKPDEVDYNFERYFIYSLDGEAIMLKPNPRATLAEQERTNITINLYGLNKFERPEDRFRVWRQFNDSNHPIIDEFPYRFLFL